MFYISTGKQINLKLISLQTNSMRALDHDHDVWRSLSYSEKSEYEVVLAKKLWEGGCDVWF